jgi:hypothetical protein
MWKSIILTPLNVIHYTILTLDPEEPKKATLSPPRVNWGNRDALLSEAVKDIATRLYENSERPRQVTISAIAREMGKLALIQKHLDKLPYTSKALASFTETREAYAKRRIAWVVKQYQQEGILPPKWKLIREAGIRGDLASMPDIQEMIDQQLNLLREVVLEPCSMQDIQFISN